MTKAALRDLIHVTKALADETRVRVLLALRQQELCACQITALFGLAPSTMSEHLFLLKQGGLVDSRKEGRWIYYSLPGKDVPEAAREALRWVCRVLADDPRVVEDVAKLQRILKRDPAELCRKRCRKRRFCL
ncbi:MAG: winged helix-turn-helix transcriptional regulator [Verrucomicrobia bacterium]|nr:winged helix-turn-helix transcriptional regulator [Verrucomicrobiota bacterium]